MNIKSIIKQNGKTVYRTQIDLGTDKLTGKRVRTTLTAKTKRELKAKARAKTLEFEQNGQTVFKNNTEVKTFEDLFQLWFDSYVPTVKPQTAKNTSELFSIHILPQIGKMLVESITTPILQNEINEWSKTCRRYRVIKAYINRVLKYAVALGIIQHNACQNVILPKVTFEETKKIKFLTDDQLKALDQYLNQLDLSNYKNHYDAMLYRLALATGCRIGELVALEWSDVDFENRTISINKTYNQRVHLITSPKSKSSNRVVHVDNRTMLQLRQFQNAQRVSYQRLKPTIFWHGEIKYPYNFVLQYRLKKHLSASGLPEITFHAFRHTHASMLVNSGIDFKTLSDRMGHSTIQITLNLYSHISDEKRKTAVNLIDEFWHKNGTN